LAFSTGGSRASPFWMRSRKECCQCAASTSLNVWSSGAPLCPSELYSAFATSFCSGMKESWPEVTDDFAAPCHDEWWHSKKVASVDEVRRCGFFFARVRGDGPQSRNFVTSVQISFSMSRMYEWLPVFMSLALTAAVPPADIRFAQADSRRGGLY
jgi:hypothetical protein